jgi:sugar phosphate isomerase/epimerase
MSSNNLTRREFLIRTIAASGALSAGMLSGSGADKAHVPDVVVFSKIYQTLKLNYADSAALTQQAGLQGVDATVRPGGEVLPEKVKEDLPRYAEELKKQGLTMPMITTGIVSAASPHAETILRTARSLGVKYYRLGVINPSNDVPLAELIGKVRKDFKELAQLNREIGITGMLQNHSPSGRSRYLGGDLDEMQALLSGLNPGELGAAFDIGHALVVHGEQWREKFEKIRTHLSVAYAKDWKKDGGWVAMGEGDLLASGYFTELKRIKYSAPLSLHIEHDWDKKGTVRTREQLMKVLRADSAVLRSWFAS